MKDLKTAFLRAAARRAREWADSILNEAEPGEQEKAAQSPADTQISSGPPAHWIERIRQTAPDLLDFFNATQPPSQTGEGTEKLSDEASQQQDPGAARQSRAQENPSKNTPRARATGAASRGKSPEAFRDASIKVEASKLESDPEAAAADSEKISTSERAAENVEARSALEESKKRFIRFNASDESSEKILSGSPEEISSRSLIESFEAHPPRLPERLASSKNLDRDSHLESPRLFDKPKEKSEAALAEIPPPQPRADQEIARQAAREARRAVREHDDASRAAEPQKSESQKAESQKAESQKAESQKNVSFSFFQSPARPSSAPRFATEISEEADNRWPELMELDLKNSSDDLFVALDERDRLRRLDDEQRGELWSA